MYKPVFDIRKKLLLFCFFSVIQNELNEFVLRWNRRTISQPSGAPGGNPDLLFHCPPPEFQRKGIKEGQEDINIVKEVLGLDHSQVAKNDAIHELLKRFQIHNIRISTDWESALNLYVDLSKLLKKDDFSV